MLVIARPSSAPSVAPDGAIADDHAEFQEFAADALAAPERVLLGDPGDERTNLGTQAGPAELRGRFPSPVQSPASSVPADDRLRSDHVEELSPALRPDAAQPDPEDPIASLQPGTRVAAQGNLELMTEDQVPETRSRREPRPARRLRMTRISIKAGRHGSGYQPASLVLSGIGRPFATLHPHVDR